MMETCFVEVDESMYLAMSRSVTLGIFGFKSTFSCFRGKRKYIKGRKDDKMEGSNILET